MIQIEVLKQTDNSYTISFGTSTECGVVMVERDINNLKSLNESLLLSYFMVYEDPPKFTIETIPNCQELQVYLMYWFEFFNDIDAISDALVSFMEDSCGHKDVSRLLLSAMRKKVRLFNLLLLKYYYYCILTFYLYHRLDCESFSSK